MATSLDDQAINQLQSQPSKLLDKIDELRTIGVGGLVELPQLIVCGNQSSGKSSVLEAISRVRFPVKSNVCTRFATEVVLRRNSEPKVKISIEPGESRSDTKEQERLRNFNPNVKDLSELPKLIEEAKEWMGLSNPDSTGTGFSDDVLKIEISGPDKPELTLVDLPGLYISHSQDQSERGITIVRDLTKKYMKNKRSIILAIISAKNDYHLQEVLAMAETFDLTRERTLGIITQPDILEDGSEEEDIYLQFVRNDKIKLRLGWHALQNRSFKLQDISDDERDENEKRFFEHGRWASISRECVGIDSLRRRLSKILLNHVRRNLPGLITEIREKITDRQSKLKKLGPARSTVQQQRDFLLEISSNFERIASQALNGMYADEFFDGLDNNISNTGDVRRLRAVTRELNECFAKAMSIRGSRRIIDGSAIIDTYKTRSEVYMDDWTPKYIARELLEKEINEQTRKNRGIELPGNANQLLVGNLFRDQSKPWEEIAQRHLMNAWSSVQYFIYLVLRHLTDEHTYSLLMTSVLAPELEKIKDALVEKLGELTAYYKRGHPLPVGKTFLERIQKSRSERHLAALKKNLGLPEGVLGLADDPKWSFNANDLDRAATNLQSASDQLASAEIIDQMQAYYDTAIVTFIDNVAILAIENCLLSPLERIFTSQFVNNMEDEQIHALASEPEYIRVERDRSNHELEKLKTGLLPATPRACHHRSRLFFPYPANEVKPGPGNTNNGMFRAPSVFDRNIAAPTTATDATYLSSPNALLFGGSSSIPGTGNATTLPERKKGPLRSGRKRPSDTPISKTSFGALNAAFGNTPATTSGGPEPFNPFQNNNKTIFGSEAARSPQFKAPTTREFRG